MPTVAATLTATSGAEIDMMVGQPINAPTAIDPMYHPAISLREAARGLCFLNREFIELAVELNKDGVFRDVRSYANRFIRVVDLPPETNDPAGHLGSNLHDFFRLDRAGRPDGDAQVAPLDLHSAQLRQSLHPRTQRLGDDNARCTH